MSEDAGSNSSTKNSPDREITRLKYCFCIYTGMDSMRKPFNGHARFNQLEISVSAPEVFSNSSTTETDWPRICSARTSRYC